MTFVNFTAFSFSLFNLWFISNIVVFNKISIEVHNAIQPLNQ